MQDLTNIEARLLCFCATMLAFGTNVRKYSGRVRCYYTILDMLLTRKEKSARQNMKLCFQSTLSCSAFRL